MKKSIIALAIAGALTAPMIAQAGIDADQITYGAGLDLVTIEDNTGYDATPKTLKGTANYALNSTFGVQAELGLGIMDDDDMGVEADIDYTAGLYLTAQEDFGLVDGLNFQAKAGMTYIDGNVGSMELTEEDFSYGVGASYQPTGSALTYSLEYASLIDKNDIDADAVTAKVNFKF